MLILQISMMLDTRFEPAEGSTDAMTTGQLIKYSIIQLAQSGVLYAILAFIILSAALVVYLVRRRKGQITENADS